MTSRGPAEQESRPRATNAEEGVAASPGRVPGEPAQAQQHLIELLSRTALRDQAAFAQLYDATCGKLFAVSLRIVRERQIAEEVLQDAFVAVWNHARAYSPARSAPVTWMAAIVRNRSLDVARRIRELPDIDDELAGAMTDEATPFDTVAQRSAGHALHECLAELDRNQRQSIALAFFHGLTHSELAAHLGRPLGTVKTYVRRGLERLRECLAARGTDVLP